MASTIQYCIDCGNRRSIMLPYSNVWRQRCGIWRCGRRAARHSCCNRRTGSSPSCSVRHGAGRAARTRNLLRMVWQGTTLDWIVIGVLLIAAPALGSEIARRWVIAVAVVVYGYAAVGNAAATGGRHVGWCLMAVVIALALAGLKAFCGERCSRPRRGAPSGGRDARHVRAGTPTTAQGIRARPRPEPKDAPQAPRATPRVWAVRSEYRDRRCGRMRRNSGTPGRTPRRPGRSVSNQGPASRPRADEFAAQAATLP